MKQKIEIEVDVPDGMEIKCQGTRNDICPVFTPDECTGQLVCNVLLRRREPVRESEYANVYRFAICGISTTRAGCDANAALDDRLGVIRLDYEDGKLVRVELEEVSDE